MSDTKILLKLILAIFLFSTVCVAQQTVPTNIAEAQKVPSAQNIVQPDFKGDGCSYWFDWNFKDCCVKHDLAYQQSSNWRTRLEADNRLFMCVAKKGVVQKAVAPIMWLGVRIFGSGLLPIYKKKHLTKENIPNSSH